MNCANCTRSNGRLTGGSPNDMKPQDDPDKATRVIQRAQTDMIEALEFIFDWLDSGKSFAELAIELDIAVAAGVLPESSHEYSA